MYNPPRYQKYNFNPDSKEPFKLSRTGIEQFIRCPRCFYLDRRLGIGRPPTPPFTLNSAVDALLKKEFDIHRARADKHPLMESYKVDAIPFAHNDMNTWRETFEGLKFHHEKTNMIIWGAIDDLWQDPQGNIIVVDYKATSKEGVVDLENEWQISYKRQMEVYQWILRKMGFKVSETAYFVYCNGRKDKKAFNGKLEFNIVLLPYIGDDSWVEDAIVKVKQCLMSSKIPGWSANCDYCKYRRIAQNKECGCKDLTNHSEVDDREAKSDKPEKPPNYKKNTLF